MQLKFKQAVRLGRKNYGLGSHEVSDAEIAANRKFIDRLVMAGLLVEPDLAPKAENAPERAKKLQEKLAGVSHVPSKDPEPEMLAPTAQSGGEPAVPESENPSESKFKKNRRR